jgi:hypothetical protein
MSPPRNLTPSPPPIPPNPQGWLKYVVGPRASWTGYGSASCDPDMGM